MMEKMHDVAAYTLTPKSVIIKDDKNKFSKNFFTCNWCDGCNPLYRNPHTISHYFGFHWDYSYCQLAWYNSFFDSTVFVSTSIIHSPPFFDTIHRGVNYWGLKIFNCKQNHLENQRLEASCKKTKVNEQRNKKINGKPEKYIKVERERETLQI